MKEALFLAHRLPFPPNKGEKLRAYHFLRYITQRYATHLVCHIDEERDLEAARHIDLPLVSFSYHFAPRRQRKRRCITALLKSTSLTVAYFYDPKLQDVVEKILRSPELVLVFCSCAPSAEYVLKTNFSGTKIMDFMDVDSEKWQDYSRYIKSPLRWIYAEEARRHRHYEGLIAQKFHHLIFVTEQEAQLFCQKVPTQCPVWVVENGVDLKRFYPEYKSPLLKKGPTLVFTGAMDYWPNAQGICWFRQKVWPLIQKAVPNVELLIVGKDPLPEVKRLSHEPGIQVTGYVKDPRDYLALADVSIIPLQIARGIQNKILEAMAMGKPVVTTPLAAQGLKATPGRDLLVAENPLKFAEQVITLLKDPLLAEKIGKNARLTMEKHYCWTKNLAQLEKLLP